MTHAVIHVKKDTDLDAIVHRLAQIGIPTDYMLVYTATHVTEAKIESLGLLPQDVVDVTGHTTHEAVLTMAAEHVMRYDPGAMMLSVMPNATLPANLGELVKHALEVSRYGHSVVTIRSSDKEAGAINIWRAETVLMMANNSGRKQTRRKLKELLGKSSEFGNASVIINKAELISLQFV